MKKKILKLLVLIISIFTLQVDAKQFYDDEKININEQKEHSIFAFGPEINISSFIDGAIYVAGEDINISSSQDIILAIGEEIEIKEAYTKDAFLFATELEISNSEIRDLYAYAEKMKITSDISRNANLAAKKVVIDSKIMGDVNITANEIVIKKGAEIRGTLRYPENAYIRISDEAIIEKTKPYAEREIDIATGIKLKIKNFIYSYLSVAIIGIVMMLLFKNKFTKIEKEKFTTNNIAKKTGLGLLALITIPIVSALAICTVIGLPVAFIALALYVILIYVSIVPSGYFLATHLLKDRIKNKYAILLFGILIIKCLELVPFIGGIVVFISLCFGIWTMIDIRKPKTTK